MRIKAFRLTPVLLILTASTGCDNVAWEGAFLELRPPAPSERIQEAEAAVGPEEETLEPVLLGPLMYLVEREGSGEATLLPVAVHEDGGYAPLPDPADIPDLVERFSLERWEEGTEFVLFHQGVRAGLFTADGSSREDPSFCLARPVGRGILELRPQAAGVDRFLAVRRADADGRGSSALERHPGIAVDDGLRNASLDAARTLISRLAIPWPPSIPGIRRRVDAFGDGEGRRVLAASFVYGDELRVGVPEPAAYSLFLLSREEEEGFVPIFSWYQRQSADGKAFPGFLAAHDVLGVGSPDLLIEVFGRQHRGLAILGERGGEWGLVYRDPCADEPGVGALRTHP
jgi:hypothetical protein